MAKMKTETLSYDVAERLRTPLTHASLPEFLA